MTKPTGRRPDNLPRGGGGGGERRRPRPPRGPREGYVAVTERDFRINRASGIRRALVKLKLARDVGEGDGAGRQGYRRDAPKARVELFQSNEPAPSSRL